MRTFGIEEFERPDICPKCKGIMIFRGLGEYKCEECGCKEYDDYGKVRNYIEENPGANVTTISEETGVTRRSINNMLREERFEIAPDSKTFLLCELCGASIRSGRVCKKCESNYHQNYEEDVRKKMHITGGFGKAEKPEETDGSMRFKREVF